jgi:uncharacterized protein (DUF169 family)
MREIMGVTTGLELDALSEKVRLYLGMPTRPLGIRLIKPGEPANSSLAAGRRAPFCWYVREAATGTDFLVRREDLDCNKAQIVLGFRDPLFAGLEPRIKERAAALLIGPVAGSNVVMLVLTPAQAMTLCNLVPGMNVVFRKNRTVCGDGMAHVFNTHRPSMSLLCIGARTDGAFQEHELLVTLPFSAFLELPSKMNKWSAVSRNAVEGIRDRLRRRRLAGGANQMEHGVEGRGI